jgi:hypothetical protein
MLALLAIGVYVFWQAKDIATSDTNINTTERRHEVNNQLTSDKASFNNMRDKINDIQIDLPFMSTINGTFTKVSGGVGNGFCYILLQNKEGGIKNVAVLIDEIRALIVDNPDHCMRGRVVPDTPGAHVVLHLFDEEVYPAGVEYHVLNFDPNLIAKVSSQTAGQITMTPPLSEESIKKMTDELLALNHKIQIDGMAADKLEKLKNETEVNQLTGQKDEQSTGVKEINPLQFLIQLNIVRFGTISLIGIAIGILAPLYRFSVRLAAFYQAKADALRLHEIAYKQTSFASLSSALTPPMEFGNSQSIPDYLTELLRDSISRGRDDG